MVQKVIHHSLQDTACSIHTNLQYAQQEFILESLFLFSGRYMVDIFSNIAKFRTEKVGLSASNQVSQQYCWTVF